jgi:HECT-domain (ubiquitin-transferase)
MLPLIMGGGHTPVPTSVADVQKFVDLALYCRAHECDAQMDAIHRGLGCVVPVDMFPFFSASDLEALVCGNPGIDLALLERMTTYHRCSKDDTHVKHLWEVLKEFDEGNRQAFVM